MSLWTKPLSEVTFDDVEAFCAEKIGEGLRVDYKRDWSSKRGELAKDIAAFANSYGGLLLVGVEEDSATRAPGAIVGVAGDASASERVINAGLSLGPGVTPSVTDPIPLRDDPARSVYVVRVQQSPLAPHVTNDRDRVYVRTGDINTPIVRAEIERIESLIERRRGWAQARHQSVKRCWDRFTALGGPAHAGQPHLWWSIGPAYPVGDVVDVDACREHVQYEGETRRVDRGAIATRPEGANIDGGLEHFWSIDATGLVFAVDARQSRQRQGEPMVVYIQWIAMGLRAVAIRACKLYRDRGSELSGPLVVTAGVRDAGGGVRTDWPVSRPVQCFDRR